jgi:3-mercaptopyruvate sulfurtransferase SseA
VKNHFPRAAAIALALCVAGLIGSAVAAQTSQEDDLSSPKLRIAWDEFRKLHDAGKVVVIDVRGDVPYRAGHIPGARSIPYDQVDRHAPELKKLKKPIVLYCA